MAKKPKITKKQKLNRKVLRKKRTQQLVAIGAEIYEDAPLISDLLWTQKDFDYVFCIKPKKRKKRKK